MNTGTERPNRPASLLPPMMLTVMLLLMTLPQAITEISHCTDLNKLTSVHQGQRLTGHTFLSLEVRSVMACAQACLNRKRCKSFNQLLDFGQCELNLNTSVETGGLTSASDFVYSDIDPWTKAVSRECKAHSCSYTQMCQPSLPTLCQQCSDETECGVCYPVTEISGRKFDSYGCYKYDTVPVLSNFLADFKPLDYSNVTKAILDCAALVAPTNDTLFGIGDAGLCYSGNVAEANFANPTSVALCADACWAGVGQNGYMFIFRWI